MSQLLSSFANVKLSASIGFHTISLERVIGTIRQIEVFIRISHKIIGRSELNEARSECLSGSNRMRHRLSPNLQEYVLE